MQAERQGENGTERNHLEAVGTKIPDQIPDQVFFVWIGAWEISPRSHLWVFKSVTAAFAVLQAGRVRGMIAQ